MWQGGLWNMKLILTPFMLGFVLALPGQAPLAPRPNCIRMTPEKERQIDRIVEKIGDFLNNLTIDHEHFDIPYIKLSIEQHTEDEVEEKETVLQILVNNCHSLDDETEEIDRHIEKAKQQDEETPKEAKKLKQEQQNEENAKKSDAHQKSKTSKNEQETQKNNEHPDVHEQQEADDLKKEQERQGNNENSKVHRKGDEISKKEHENQDTEEKRDEISKKEHENHDTDDKAEAADEKEVENLKNNDVQAIPGKRFKVMYLNLDKNGQELLKAMDTKKKTPRVVYVQEHNSGQTEYWFMKQR